MPKALVNGIQIHYETCGQGEPLLLISGLNCDSRLWSFVQGDLKDHFKVIYFDNRGTGQSDCPDIPYTIQTMAEDAIALLDVLKIPQAYVLGHSMGGTIAQMMAHLYPQRVKKLIIANSLIKVHPLYSLLGAIFVQMRKWGLVPPNLMEKVMPLLFSKQFRRSNKDAVKEIIRNFLLNTRSNGRICFNRQFRALWAFNSSAWLKEIKTPTLVIAADEDILCPRDSQKIAKAIPGAKLYTFRNAGHIPLIEKPEEFNRQIIQFLQE